MNTPQAPTGLLVMDKETGYTSMDVCAIVRSRLKRGGAPKRVKVGHAGTLDPAATGVLLILIGSSTRLVDRFMATRKRYIAEVDLSCTSTTDDREGATTQVPVLTPPGREAIDVALARFIGAIQQVPPAFSAIHIDGQRAYALAREGKAVEIPARPVVVYAISVVAYAFPKLVLDIACGKGTYIRSIARDLGPVLGTGGLLAGLQRTEVGDFTLEMSARLADVPDPLLQEHLRDPKLYLSATS